MEPNRSEYMGGLLGKIMAWFGAIASTVSGLSLNDVGVIVGIAIGVFGLCLNQFWTWRKQVREARFEALRLAMEREEQAARMAIARAEHEARMAEYGKGTC